MGPSPPSPLLPSPPPPPVPPFSFGLPRASFLLFLKFSESEDAQDHSELLLCLGSNESGIETLKLLKSFYLSYLQSCFHFYKLYWSIVDLQSCGHFRWLSSHSRTLWPPSFLMDDVLALFYSLPPSPSPQNPQFGVLPKLKPRPGNFPVKGREKPPHSALGRWYLISISMKIVFIIFTYSQQIFSSNTKQVFNHIN